jgi:hypothetical protein
MSLGMPITDLDRNPVIRVRGFWFYLVRSWLSLNRRRMGHVAVEFLPERLCIIRINLPVIASPREETCANLLLSRSLAPNSVST